MTIHEFATLATCPKCGCLDPDVRHHPFPMYDSLHCAATHNDSGEHLCFKCERCGFRWATRTRDSAEVIPQ